MRPTIAGVNWLFIACYMLLPLVWFAMLHKKRALLNPKGSEPDKAHKERNDNPELAPLRFLFALLWAVICYRYFVYSLLQAYDIRLIAIREYGHIIHEFDPWFNYRATEYLYEHGWRAFKSWYDYKVWYPLGRPVGTTIYPGMQVRV